VAVQSTTLSIGVDATPIKQVISAITGLPRVAFTAMHACRILTALGFEVKELNPGESE